MNKLSYLFDKNREWAAEMREQDPDFFLQLSKQQTPKYLWIGCSDSRVPANQIIDLPPGEVFVHRNISNLVVHTDLNCLSVIQYAIEVLKVKHVIVCGHYGCGGIKAAMDNQAHGLIDNWIRHIKDVLRVNTDKLEGLAYEKKFDLLCELNVIEQVVNVCNTTIVQDAWENNFELSIHGWIYNIKNGILQELEECVSSKDELKRRYWHM